MKKTLTFETAHKLAELYANRYETSNLRRKNSAWSSSRATAG